MQHVSSASIVLDFSEVWPASMGTGIMRPGGIQTKKLVTWRRC